MIYHMVVYYLNTQVLKLSYAVRFNREWLQETAGVLYQPAIYCMNCQTSRLEYAQYVNQQ